MKTGKKTNSKKTQSKRSNQKTRGGSNWQYTQAVYGGPTEQVAGSLYGNEIAANNLSGKNFCTGGSAPKGGKGILTDIAVPAVLLYANNMIKFKKSSPGTRRKRKYRRASRKSAP